MKKRNRKGIKAAQKRAPEKQRKISDRGLIALVLVIVALLAAAPMTAVAAVNLQEKHPQVFRESTGNEPFFSEIGELTQIGVTPENGPARSAAKAPAKAAPQTGTLYSIYTNSFPKGAPGNTGTWGNLSTCVSHAMQINGAYNAAYCLDKELGYQAGAGHTTTGTTIDDIRGLKRETIGFILANGFQWNSGSIWSQTDNDHWLVTQLLIWAAKDGKITIDKATHQISVPKSIRSDIVKISSKVYSPSGFTAYFDSLVLKLEKVRKIPSFCSYPEETLDGVKLAATKENALLLRNDSSGRYSWKEVDKNNVLSNYSAVLTKAGFIPEVTIFASGSTLSLSTNIAEKSGKNTASYKPNGGAGAVVAWRYAPDPSHYQRFASAAPATSEVKALLSIGADTAIPSGGPKITKWSEDGIVAGMQFGISGSDGSYYVRSTDSNGEIDLSDLPAYEKIPVLDDDGNPVIDEETGEPVTEQGDLIVYTAQEINVPIRYVTPAPQSFNMASGDVLLEFENIVKKWCLNFTKRDVEIGYAQGDATLAGAVYGVYQNGQLLDTYTTDADGKFTTGIYFYGDGYTVQEISPSEGYLLSDEVISISMDEIDWRDGRNAESMIQIKSQSAPSSFEKTTSSQTTSSISNGKIYLNPQPGVTEEIVGGFKIEYEWTEDGKWRAHGTKLS